MPILAGPVTSINSFDRFPDPDVFELSLTQCWHSYILSYCIYSILILLSINQMAGILTFNVFYTQHAMHDTFYTIVILLTYSYTYNT